MAGPWDRVSQAMQRNAALVSGAALESYGNMGRMAQVGISQGLGNAIPAYQDARLRQSQIQQTEMEGRFLPQELEQRAHRGILQIARDQKELDAFDARLMREAGLYDLEMKQAQARMALAQAKLIETEASTAEMMAEGARADQVGKQAAQAAEMQLRSMVTFDKDGHPMGVTSGDSAGGFEVGQLSWEDPRVQMTLQQGGLFRDPRSGQVLPIPQRQGSQPKIERTQFDADIAQEVRALMEESKGASDERRAEIDKRLSDLRREQRDRWQGREGGANGAADQEADAMLRGQSEDILRSLFGQGAAPQQAAPGAQEPADRWSTAAWDHDMDRFAAGGIRNKTMWETARQATGMGEAEFRAAIGHILRQRVGPGSPPSSWFNEEIEPLLMDILLSPQEFREAR